MQAESYVQKELELIHPLYFSIFNEENQRWHIRKWNSVFLANHKIVNWKFASINILTIRKENETGSDIGYMPLDMRAIKAVRLGLWGARNVKRIKQEVDNANQYNEEKADQELDYVSRYMAKNIWHKFQEPSVFIHRS